jgi:DNA invertase Pin-like site-specific DNA recombinase
MNNQDPIAERKAAKLAKRHGIETLAQKAGAERAKLDDELAANTQWIIDLMPDAIEAGIPFDTYAKLVGVSRQTLYRWKGVVRRLNAEN